MKKYCFLLLCVLLCISLLGCNDYHGNRPIDQPNTTWISEDGNIVIEVDSEGLAVGCFYADEEKINFLFRPSPVTILMYQLDEDILSEDNETIIWSTANKPLMEKWQPKFSHNDHFTIRVKETTYFEIGQKIEFYRKD